MQLFLEHQVVIFNQTGLRENPDVVWFGHFQKDTEVYKLFHKHHRTTSKLTQYRNIYNTIQDNYQAAKKEYSQKKKHYKKLQYIQTEINRMTNSTPAEIYKKFLHSEEGSPDHIMYEFMKKQLHSSLHTVSMVKYFRDTPGGSRTIQTTLDTVQRYVSVDYFDQ